MKLKLTRELLVHPDDRVRCGFEPGVETLTLPQGAAVDVPDNFGEKLLRKGGAELVKVSPVETAAVKAPETAAASPPKRRVRRKG